MPTTRVTFIEPLTRLAEKPYLTKCSFGFPTCLSEFSVPNSGFQTRLTNVSYSADMSQMPYLTSDLPVSAYLFHASFHVECR